MIHLWGVSALDGSPQVANSGVRKHKDGYKENMMTKWQLDNGVVQ